MAGLGRRTFAAGEVLTAGNVMGYLQDQAVMNFAGTAARGSAIGTAVSEGMVSYLADSNQIQVYDGSAWLGLGPSGQILQISHMKTSTQVNSASGTPVNTGISIAFTPISATSKIIVITSINGIGKTSASTTTGAQFYLRKDSSAVQTYGVSTTYELANHVGYGLSGTYVETSGSLTARTYAVWFNQLYTGGTINVQRDGAESTMTVIEVSQ